jgi:hypothetical protein
MLLQLNDIQQSLQIARKHRQKCDAKFPKHKNRSMRSIDHLVDLLQSEGYKIEINLIDISHAAQAVRGTYFAKEDGSYIIFLLAGQNLCWTRLVLCKEIFHILLDRPECRTMSIENLIDELANIIITEPKPSAALSNEILTEVAAMEFIFPYEFRKLELAQGTPNYYEIAEKYRCPLQMVEKYLHNANMNSLMNT